MYFLLEKHAGEGLVSKGTTQRGSASLFYSHVCPYGDFLARSFERLSLVRWAGLPVFLKSFCLLVFKILIFLGIYYIGSK